jgi:adenylate cyclase
VNRVLRTFGFVDISGFTAYVDVNGDEPAIEALRQFRFAVREIASLNGVRVDKWLGDGAMFVCVDTEPLVRTVIDLADRLASESFPLPLRAGIDVGMVILFEADDYIGMPVNLASRLCAEAAPGETLVTAEVADLVRAEFAQLETANLEVRGIAHAVTVVSLARNVGTSV